MKRRTCPYASRRNRRRGMSLAEVIVSSLLVGLVLVGALRCVGGVIRGSMAVATTARAEQLAQQLLTEILNDAYIDPGPLPVFGPEADEPATATGSRSGWDDVDDYHLWSESPPRDRNGNTLPKLGGWRRDVTVEWVDPANPATASMTDQKVKRITVAVRRNGVLMATAVALRSEKYLVP